MLTLTAADNGRHVAARVNEVIELRLAENATTGYRWEPDHYDGGLLQWLETTALYPEGAVGAGGEAVFRFKVVAAGSGVLALKYWRHWEGTGSIVQRYAVTVDANP